jgi:membrane-associated phospholipid phosphatase/tRNA A-37 threonylcarbamoyl transferase component Bud32
MVDAPVEVAGSRGRLGRVRRPSGEPPPLPRHLERWDWIRLALSAGVIVVYVVLLKSQTSRLWLDKVDHELMEPIVDGRTKTLTSIARDLEDLASGWAIHILRWTAFALLVLSRRFRHLLVLIFALALTAFVANGLVDLFKRERPLGVEIIGSWNGYSHPSLPIVALASTLCGYALVIAPPGRIRRLTEIVCGLAISLAAVSRVYLGADHPSDVIFGTLLTVTLVALVFRLLAPEEAFPVAYRRGRTAHLDLDEARREGIRTGIWEQLGIGVEEIKPFGLAGSAGSTPMRLTTSGEPRVRLFAKLYASNHVRSDRWYKLGREILYGRLEDESSFSTVRRLVQYEDYVMRVMRDAEVPVVQTHGIVEITPEREYVLVTDFLEGGREIGDPDVEVDDQIIDEALSAVRAMWDGGVAHRDIKPSNVMVREGHATLIDVAFGQIRPSAWREAVDLANMMLVLALKTDAERVYRRACELFNPQEIAEAFAATKGITVPTQLRSAMRADERDLIQEFRDLAPPHPPIAIQRWTLRRLGLMTATLAVGLAFTGIVLANLFRVPA